MDAFNVTLLALANAIVAALFFWRPKKDHGNGTLLPATTGNLPQVRKEQSPTKRPKRSLKKWAAGTLAGASLLAFSITYNFVDPSTELHPVSGVDADMYAPTAWTDTVHHETFTGLAASQLFSTLNEQNIFPFTTVFTGDNNVTGNCSGGEITGYSNPCRALDSINVPGQLSPPWVWEARVGALGNAGMQWTLNFANGNGSAAGANLTRWYMRMSIYFEEDGTDHGQFDYPFHGTSHKMFNPNGIDNGFLQTWYESPFIWEQAGGSLNGCNVGLEPNTWIEYYPSDTVPPQSGGGNGTCEHLGRGGMHKRGIMQHWFICVDYSPPSGSRIVSWGVVDAEVNGIAGYHNNQTTWHNTGASDFDAVTWNGTIGGGPPYPAQDVSIWWDDLLVLTGSSGSCQTPPSFS